MAALVGIRREDKSRWERRAPLTPDQVSILRRSEALDVLVQPSTTRIHTDLEYARAGARIDEDLSACNVIFGIKEIPPEALQARQTYVFFSHTIKGQLYNMPMLRRLMELGCQLIDYERIVDENGRRLVFFGRHAGLAGMIDTLWALGQRLSWEGIANPFEHIRQASAYHDLDHAKAAVRKAGEVIASDGLPASLEPLVIGIAGYGNVSRGAQEILDLLPHEEVAPSRLPDLFESLRSADHRIYKVVFREEDMVEPLMACEQFDLPHYYDHPDDFRSRFESFIPYLTVLVNAIYWDARYPRLLTCKSVKQLYARQQPRLRVIGDISCDIEGAIECTLKCTTQDEPLYVYNPCTGDTTAGVAGKGPVILALDILPAELPRESSISFGEALLPFVPAIARADYRVPFEACDLPAEIRRAVICYQGNLTPDYRYLEEVLRENQQQAHDGIREVMMP
jgi:hypothetical protein